MPKLLSLAGVGAAPAKASILRFGLPVAIALSLAVALALGGAATASASTSQSSNWAGYAIHRAGVSFKYVASTWRQPRATCAPGAPAYSSMWVGIGGYSLTSDALEQIGSDVNCTGDKTVSSVWYELYPAPSRSIRMKVGPGDQLAATVTVTGHEVRLSLRDLTRRTGFTKTVRVAVVDASSAEWILEAPTGCYGSSCRVMALADFGSTTFSHNSAVTTTGHVGAISDRAWDLSEITLATGPNHFASQESSGSAVGAAPSSLAGRGSAFSVTYRGGAAAPPVSTAAAVPPVSAAAAPPVSAAAVPPVSTAAAGQGQAVQVAPAYRPAG